MNVSLSGLMPTVSSHVPLVLLEKAGWCSKIMQT